MSFVHIQTVELSSDQQNIVFTSIPQTFQDLCVYMDVRSIGGDGSAVIQIYPNQSSSGLDQILIQGTTTVSRQSNSQLQGLKNNNSGPANHFAFNNIYFHNYSEARKKLMSVYASSFNSGYVLNRTTRGRSTSTLPITSLKFELASNTNYLAAGTVISLYGINPTA